jgi:hypothetical protein
MRPGSPSVTVRPAVITDTPEPSVVPHTQHPLDSALADLDVLDDRVFSAGEAPHGRLARTLLIAVFCLGLLGLSVGQSGVTPAPSPITLALTPTASVSEMQLLAPVRVTPKVASRTRSASATPPARKPVKKTVRVVKRKVVRPSWVRPSRSGVISSYGPRWGRMHKGIDFADSYGDPIYAIGSGVVLGAGYLGSESGYGKITLIQHRGGIISAYAHQSRIAVSPGERVRAGEVIGYVGSTGHSTGPHLHFEIRTGVHSGQLNPLRWLRSHGVRI